MRSHHADSKYIFLQQRYLKEFAVMFKDNCSFISSDDKALIPVGEPGHAISTGVHTHNASLGPLDRSGVVIGALDHNWKVAGIVSSVNLFTEIPESSISSIFWQ